jgi:tetratricopeptide (TPR) repeat protein
MARLGEANNLYYLGRHEEAAEAFGRLLDQHPDHLVAVHNLTILLLEMHRPCEARAVVAAADSLTGALMDTARRAVADACPAG